MSFADHPSGPLAEVVPLTHAERLDSGPVPPEGWYQAVLEALPAAVYVTDAEGRITFYNKAAAELAGNRPALGVDKWCVSWRLRHPDGSPLEHDQCPMAVALRTGEPVRGVEAIAERPDGTTAPFMPFPTPLKNAEGRVVGAINLLVDISDRKRAEEQQKVLVDELNHRVKNTLAIVQSIAFQTMRSAGAGESFAGTFEARLMALSKAHDLLTSRLWSGAGLHEVLSQQLQGCAADDPNRVRLDGPMVSLTPRMTVALALAAHELASNALRHGSLRAGEGRLEVHWRINRNEAGADELALTWIEADGPPVSRPLRTGFGVRLLERTVRGDLGGSCELDFRPEGLRCEIVAPLERAA
jgi:PAS domain S-box-containing protein